MKVTSATPAEFGISTRYAESHRAIHAEKRETDGPCAVTHSLTPPVVQVTEATNSACCLNRQGGDHETEHPSATWYISMISLDYPILKFLAQMMTQFHPQAGTGLDPHPMRRVRRLGHGIIENLLCVTSGGPAHFTTSGVSAGSGTMFRVMLIGTNDRF